MAMVAEVLRRNAWLSEWVAFVTQVLFAISIEVGDDIGRGVLAQHGTAVGIRNAHNIVAFEAAHGFWVEPGWQRFFEQPTQVFGLNLTWPDMAHLMNVIYIGGHVFVTMATALWIYTHHRSVFPFVRNIMIATNALALCVYENFPVAPPRLTTNLIYDHHAFTFQDTIFGLVGSTGRFGAAPVGYNEFSAMPSVHMAWALVVAGCLFILVRPIIFKLAGILYPAAMLLAVVVTGNHYIADALVSGIIVVLATALALILEYVWAAARGPRYSGVLTAMRSGSSCLGTV